MSYFKLLNLQCNQHPKEWNQVLDQIKGQSDFNPISKQISQSLEAKALYIFTMARRLTRTSHRLGKPSGWKPVFIEAIILLFPMLELIGHSRLEVKEVNKHYHPRKNQRHLPSDVNVANLWAGLHWLRDPNWLPQVKSNQLKYDADLVSKWQIGHLISLRHYLLHGAKKEKDKKGNPIPIPDIISYELPEVIIQKAQQSMSDYWKLLKQDNGNQGSWLDRLAQADIQPLKIQGSVDFEHGLVDLDIVDYLEGRAVL